MPNMSLSKKMSNNNNNMNAIITNNNKQNSAVTSFDVLPCIPTAKAVTAYLTDIKTVHDMVTNSNDPLKIYYEMLDYEREYTLKGAKNYAKMVHLIHSNSYQADISTINSGGCGRLCIMDRLCCPLCSESMPLKEKYNVHILKSMSVCSKCNSSISYEGLSVSVFIEDFNNGRYGNIVNFNKKLSYSNCTSTWVKFCRYVDDLFLEEVGRFDKKSQATILDKWRKDIDTMIHRASTGGISKFSIDLVHEMYLHLDFIAKVCSNYSYWTGDVIDTSIDRYKKFMLLLKMFPSKSIISTLDIDLVWYTHRINVDDYQTFSIKYFSKLVDERDLMAENNRHPVSLDKAYAETFILWNQYFMSDYSSVIPKFTAWQKVRYLMTKKASTKYLNANNMNNNSNDRINISNHSDCSSNSHDDVVFAIGIPVMDTKVKPFYANKCLAYEQALLSINTFCDVGRSNKFSTGHSSKDGGNHGGCDGYEAVCC